jgi:hypothetical protein
MPPPITQTRPACWPNHRRPQWLALILLLLASAGLSALSGCKTLIQQTEHGRWVEIGADTALILHQPMTIPQDRARAFIVNGRLSRQSAHYRTSCALEVRELARQGPQHVRPGRLQIVRAQHYWTQVAAHLRDSGVFVQVAELSNGGGQPLIQTGYRFWLKRLSDADQSASGDKPGAASPMHLTCLGILAEPAEAYPPTITELAQTLGALATLRL